MQNKKTLKWFLKKKQQILKYIYGLFVVGFIIIFYVVVLLQKQEQSTPPPAMTYEEVIHYYSPTTSIPPLFQVLS